MTENSPASTASSPDTINVLPVLSEAKAPISLTLTIDKSVSKVAAWVIGVIVANSILIGAGVVLGIWMTFAYSAAEREARMVEYYQHEIDGKLIAAGFLKPSQNFDNFKSQHQEK